MARDVSTNAEMQAVINAGGVVTYDGRIIRKIADLPTNEQILLDFPEYSYTFNSGNARGILGYQITGTPTDQDTLIFDGTEKKWIFGASSGGGGGSLNIREVDGTPTIVGASVLEFDQGDGFIVSNPSGSVARVRINAIPDARLTSNVTLGGNTFSGTGSIVRATSPSIAKLANLSTNGFVKTSGSDGTLSVDTNTYLTSAVTSLSGTANQITASASTGTVTLSLPSSPHIAGTLFVGSTSGIQFGDGGGISGTTTGFIAPVSDGVFRFGDAAGGGSPHIILGSSSSSFVRIKRNGTTLAVRLGDDSGDAPISASSAAFSGTITSGTWNGSVVGSAYGGAGSVTGILKANGSGTVSAASSGTDYAPATSGNSILYGNASGGFSNVTVGSGLSFSSGTLSATGGGSQTPWTSNIDSDGFNLLVDDSTGIKSSETSNPNLLIFTSASSAANWITIKNSSSGNNVEIGTDGSDTAVRLKLNPKGGVYPDGPSVELPTGVRYDNPELSWGGALKAYGIHQNSGGGWMSINCSNLALGAGGAQGGAAKYVAMLGNTLLAWSGNTATPIDDGDNSTYLILGRRAAANLRFGDIDTDLNSAIVAQTISVQGALTGGTTNQAGKDFTIDLSRSKGTGAGGGLVIRATPPGSSSSTLNSYTPVLTIPSVGGMVIPAITAPATPSANNVHLYAKVNGIYYKGENGTEIGPLGAGGGGGTTINSSDNVIPYRSNSTTFTDSPLSVASGAVTLTRNSLGTTVTDSSIITNTSAATNGSQQISPATVWEGRGWGTTAGTSQSVKFASYVLPIQGTVPTSQLVFASSIAGGAYTSVGKIGSNGIFYAGTGLYFDNVINVGIFPTDNLTQVFQCNGTNRFAISGNDVKLLVTSGQYLFNNGSEGIERLASGILGVNNGTAIGTTPGNARDLKLRGVHYVETTTDPTAAELTVAGSNAKDTFKVYMKNDKFVIAYNNAGTVTYIAIPLDGATTTFTHSTTAP